MDYLKCCCAPQRTLHRKEHTRYAVPPHRQGWRRNYCYPNGQSGSRTASSRMRRFLGSYSFQFSPKLMPALPPSCRHCSRSPCHRHNRCCPRHCTALQRLPPFFYFICHIYIHFSKITNCDLKRVVTYYYMQR